MAMKKVFLYLCIVLFFDGCASIYFKAGEKHDYNQEYVVDAKMRVVQEYQFPILNIKNILFLYINNELVLECPLAPDHTGSFKSLYQGKQLKLECNDIAFIGRKTFCQVYLDQKEISNFKLVLD